MTDLIAIITILNLLFFFILCIENTTFNFVNPFWLYKNIKVNWFGAFLIGIVLTILLPIISIPYWIYKLCTVGRE